MIANPKTTTKKKQPAKPSKVSLNGDKEDSSEDDDSSVDVDRDEVSNFRDPPIGFVRMRPSQFKGLPSVIFMEYPPGTILLPFLDLLIYNNCHSSFLHT